MVPEATFKLFKPVGPVSMPAHNASAAVAPTKAILILLVIVFTSISSW